MKKSEIAKGLDLKATGLLGLAAIAQTIISVLNNITRVAQFDNVVDTIVLVFVSVISIFAYVFIVKGFSTVNKACKISEKNENYYMGRNLTVFSIICIVLSIVFAFLAFGFSAIIAKYNTAEYLSQADIQARNNVLVLTSVISILMQVFSVSTVFIFYLWKVYKLTPAEEKISKFALLAVVVFVVHLVISSLNSVYAIRNQVNDFLPAFSSILNTLKYVLLTLFFVKRKTYLEKIKTEE